MGTRSVGEAPAKEIERIFAMCGGCGGDRNIKVSQFDKGEVLCDDCAKAQKG